MEESASELGTDCSRAKLFGGRGENEDFVEVG